MDIGPAGRRAPGDLFDLLDGSEIDGQGNKLGRGRAPPDGSGVTPERCRLRAETVCELARVVGIGSQRVVGRSIPGIRPVQRDILARRQGWGRGKGQRDKGRRRSGIPC